MKKILLMITMVLGISVLAQAQTKQHRGHGTPDQQAAHITKMLQNKLNLSADQSAQVNAILLTRATQMDSLRANKNSDKQAYREAIKSLLGRTDSQLSAVFTADQNKTYMDMKAQMKDRFKSGKGFMAHNHDKGEKNPGEKAQHMTGMLQQKLNLSADQTARVNAILLTRATQMDSLKNNLATDDKKINHKSRKLIMQKTDEDLKAVFNADQLKAYDQIKSEMKERHKNKKDVMAAPAEGK